MKIDATNLFMVQGDFPDSEEFSVILDEIHIAIKSVNWGDDKKFIINPIRKGNGVVPIKNNFISRLIEYGWEAEVRMSLAAGMNPGPIDVVKDTPYGKFAVEWETGNISSSHRALNKIAVGIIQNQIIGGMLILPIKNFSKYLTDRIGNYEELAPYFPMYGNLRISEGVIGVISMEHDGESTKSPIIPKGQDGNAKSRRKK